MEFIIVTGMSGAGKSGAAKALEDIGYYCVDNMPPALLPKFSEICMQSQDKISKVAMVVDSRGGKLFEDLFGSLEELQGQGNPYRILFLDCDNDALITRYKETRRKHPLCEHGASTLEEAIRLERMQLGQAKQRASYVIDTTLLTAAQLREKVIDIFAQGCSSLLINCMSFGFKYGLPSEADLVFDVRCLPNPFYIPQLKPQTGKDQPVADYVLQFEQSRRLLEKLCDLLDYSVPLYIQEGKSQLMIAVGCTGGKHRSVLFAERIAAFLSRQDYRVVCNHRDILKIK